MPDAGRVAIGSVAGAILAAFIAPFLWPMFSVPGGGVGWVTVNQYPKGWDYAVVALLFAGAAIGGILAAARVEDRRSRLSGQAELPVLHRIRCWPLALLVFILMLFVHDHPYAIMENFHEGEHLVPAFLLKSGERPYRDIFFLHGLGTDGGLDALVLGDPPSPKRTRRLQTVLDAATLALLVPIAAQVCMTGWGVAAATLTSLCAIAAFWLPVFPYFRVAPVLLATLGMLGYARTGRKTSLALAFFAATLGVLWSLDTGTYALAAAVVTLLLVRKPDRSSLIVVLAAFLAPFVVLSALGADIPQFFRDSFVFIPRAIDAVWSLPAPSQFTMEALRYYLPPAFYGFLIALALLAYRRGDRARASQLLIVALFSILLFRTAAGRVSWSHTRYALPLFGIALIAFVVEPLFRARKFVVAVTLAAGVFVLVQVAPNLTAGAKLLAGWRGRQQHEGLVRYPVRAGKGIFAPPDHAAEIAALNGLVESFEPDATFLDFSGERALYYLLQRKPPMRNPDIHMLSHPPLLAEAMAELNANPPRFVIVEGAKALGEFDGVPNRVRVPALAAWIDARYPNRQQIGRFVVATP